MPGCRVLVGPSGSAWTPVTDAHGLDIWQMCSLWSKQSGPGVRRPGLQVLTHHYNRFE